MTGAKCWCTWATVGGRRFRTRRKCSTCRDQARAERERRYPWRRDPLMAGLSDLRQQARREAYARQDAAWLRLPGPAGTTSPGQLARFNAGRVENKYWSGVSFAEALGQVRRTT